MKIQIMAALITITALAGCTSSATSEQAKGASTEIKNKINTGEQLTNEELNELAGKN